MHKLTYHTQKSMKDKGGYAFQALQDKKARAKQKNGWGGSIQVG
jgi:hypothetical protein